MAHTQTFKASGSGARCHNKNNMMKFKFVATRHEILSLIEQLNTQGDIAAEKVIQKLLQIGKPAVPFLLGRVLNLANRV
jgi:hypothetical protein